MIQKTPLNLYDIIKTYSVEKYNDNPNFIDFKRDYLRKYNREIGNNYDKTNSKTQ